MKHFGNVWMLFVAGLVVVTGVSGAVAGYVDGVSQSDPVPVAADLKVAAVACPPGATVIDFDDVLAPCAFVDTVRLTEQYAPLGVHFSGPGGNDGGAILDTCGNFGVSPVSGSNFLAFNRGSMLSDGGIPSDPETIIFDDLASEVSIYAAGGNGSGADFTMRAYNIDDVLVDSDTVVTVSWALLSVSSAGGIKKVVLEEAGMDSAFVYDHLCFVPRGDIDPPEPNNPDPCDGATDVPTDTCLSWNEGKPSQPRNSFSLDQAIMDSDDIKVDLTEVLFNGVGDSIEVAAPVQLAEETRTDDSDVLVYIGNDGRNEGYGDVTAAIAGIGGTTTITSVWPARLDGYCTVYLAVNRSPFDGAQLTSLVNYVNGGGTLVAMGDWDDWAGSANAVMNNVATALGSSMSITPDRIDMECHLTTLIETHPLTAGVSSLQFGFTSIVNVGSGTLLVRSEPSAVPMLAVEVIGSGLFILCGDSNIFSDLCSGAGDRQQLVQNICGGLECPTTWDLYLGTDPCALDLIASDLDEPNCCPGEMAYETTYFWRIVAKNCRGETRGPVWSFTTELRNQDPNCSNAVASISEAWPPNHKWQAVEILGVEDPDGDPVSITITGITQDEPVVGLGSGNTAPDGAGIGLGRAFIRAERSGQGNGRVYEIHFEADDGMGGVCNGTVSVCVPHDKGKDGGCIDDGQFYNSRALQLLRADFNDDGKVDQHDFAIFSAYWLDSYELDEAPVDDE
ncbi:MAG: hypothetical protein ACYS8I_00970 [Planctomycetota bacterium]|jgi:hypothetical protein